MSLLLTNRLIKITSVATAALLLAGCSLSLGSGPRDLGEQGAPETFPKTESIDEWCTEVYKRAAVDQFNESHGVDVEASSEASLSAMFNPNKYGDGFGCSGARTIITVTEATDEAAANEMVGDLQAIDDYFPTSSRDSISLQGAEGRFSYDPDPTYTLSSLDLKRGTLVISIIHAAVSAEPPESDVKDFLYRIAYLSLSMPLPPYVPASY